MYTYMGSALRVRCVAIALVLVLEGCVSVKMGSHSGKRTVTCNRTAGLLYIASFHRVICK